MLPGGRKLPGFLHWAVKRRQLALGHALRRLKVCFARETEKNGLAAQKNTKIKRR